MNYEKWKIKEVKEWLKKIQEEEKKKEKEEMMITEEIINKFEKNKINGELLKEITNDELKNEILIEEYGVRKFILNEIKKLKEKEEIKQVEIKIIKKQIKEEKIIIIKSLNEKYYLYYDMKGNLQTTIKLKKDCFFKIQRNENNFYEIIDYNNRKLCVSSIDDEIIVFFDFYYFNIFGNISSIFFFIIKKRKISWNIK
jgi:hypothetical protein